MPARFLLVSHFAAGVSEDSVRTLVSGQYSRTDRSPRHALI